MDDTTQIVSVNLKQSLIPDPIIQPRPLNFHERTEMILARQENVLQDELDRFALCAEENKLLINRSKCFLMQILRSRKYDFPPEFSVKDSEILEVKKTHKIFGVLVQDDLKWEFQVQEMVRKATKTTRVRAKCNLSKFAQCGTLALLLLPT